jgi:thiamine-phosphate pyrophosphorylase
MPPRSDRVAERRPAPRLYLLTPPATDAERLATTLAAALAAADVAAVLVGLGGADERAMINVVKALAPAVQDKGAALLIDGHPEIVARAGADGAHLTGIAAFDAALATLKPARIAGAGGLRTRHDAMLAAEAGADYVMFGEPEGQQRPSFAAIVERVAWWAELFEPPCVGYAETVAEVGQLAAAGADFVAVGDFVWRDARGPGAAITAAAQYLLAPEATG